MIFVRDGNVEEATAFRNSEDAYAHAIRLYLHNINYSFPSIFTPSATAEVIFMRLMDYLKNYNVELPFYVYIEEITVQ